MHAQFRMIKITGTKSAQYEAVLRLNVTIPRKEAWRYWQFQWWNFHFPAAGVSWNCLHIQYWDIAKKDNLRHRMESLCPKAQAEDTEGTWPFSRALSQLGLTLSWSPGHSWAVGLSSTQRFYAWPLFLLGKTLFTLDTHVSRV